jgi:hypothetical protein
MKYDGKKTPVSVLKIKKVSYLGWKETFISSHDLGIKWVGAGSER